MRFFGKFKTNGKPQLEDKGGRGDSDGEKGTLYQLPKKLKNWGCTDAPEGGKYT